jgi:uncharacterized phage-like protein YoqJ
MINADQSICFTGHRPDRLGGYAPNPIQDWVKNELEAVIIKALNGKTEYFVSGGALGVDQWAAEIVIEIKKQGKPVNLCIAKPFPSQASRWKQEARAAYEKILKESDKIIEVSEGGFAAWKMHKRNRWMVDNSKYVIAVWDNEKKGGTWNCLEYALKKRKKVFVINPFEKRVGWFEG